MFEVCGKNLVFFLVQIFRRKINLNTDLGEDEETKGDRCAKVLF